MIQVTSEQVDAVFDNPLYQALCVRVDGVMRVDAPEETQELNESFNGSSMAAKFSKITFNSGACIPHFEFHSLVEDSDKILNMTQEQVSQLVTALNDADSNNPIIAYNKAQFALADAFGQIRTGLGEQHRGIASEVVEAAQSGEIAVEPFVAYLVDEQSLDAA